MYPSGTYTARGSNTIQTTAEFIRSPANIVDKFKSRDFISTLKFPSQAEGETVAGSILHRSQVSPFALVGSRIEYLAQIYERYIFTKFDVHYLPCIQNFLGAQCVAYIDTDPADDPSLITSVTALRQQAVNQEGAVVFHTGDGQYSKCSDKPIAKLVRTNRLSDRLYTSTQDNDLRFTSQGTFNVIMMNNIVGSDLQTSPEDIDQVGTFVVDWEVEFSMPQGPNPRALSRLTTEAAMLDFGTISIQIGNYNSDYEAAFLAELQFNQELAIGLREIEFAASNSTWTGNPAWQVAAVYVVAAFNSTLGEGKPLVAFGMDQTYGTSQQGNYFIKPAVNQRYIADAAGNRIYNNQILPFSAAERAAGWQHVLLVFAGVDDQSETILYIAGPQINATDVQLQLNATGAQIGQGKIGATGTAPLLRLKPSFTDTYPVGGYDVPSYLYSNVQGAPSL